MLGACGWEEPECASSSSGSAESGRGQRMSGREVRLGNAGLVWMRITNQNSFRRSVTWSSMYVSGKSMLVPTHRTDFKGHEPEGRRRGEDVSCHSKGQLMTPVKQGAS